MADSSSEVTANGFTLTRIFDAPRELVWKTFTEPEHFRVWFGGTEADVPLETCSMDVREGGEWKATMHIGRDELPFAGVYREVVEPERLVFTYEDPGDTNVEVATVTFADLGDRTEVVFNQTGHLPEDEYPRTAEGTSGFFDTLADHLAEVQAQG